MRKLLGIMVLSLLWSNVANAKDIKLICTDLEDEAISHILIINDNKKTLIVEDEPGITKSTDVTIYNKDEIWGDIRIKIKGKTEQQIVYNIDRRTGILKLSNSIFSSNYHSINFSNCELFKENKF